MLFIYIQFKKLMDVVWLCELVETVYRGLNQEIKTAKERRILNGLKSSPSKYLQANPLF